jgi:phospholipid-binding lipoprotein MlaA
MSNVSKTRAFILTAVLALLGAPLRGQDALPVIARDRSAAQHDPFEPINRVTFGFNKVFDTFIFNPLIVSLTLFIPPPAMTGIHNVFSNLNEVASFMNHAFQGQGFGARRSLARFLINSTLGLAGLIDVATAMGLEQVPNSFNWTLKKWGIKPGFYVVWPILGPSSMRDGVGIMVDFFFDPVNVWAFASGHKRFLDEKIIVSMVQEKEKFWKELWELKADAMDPYVLERSIYYQKRHLLESFEDGPQPLE